MTLEQLGISIKDIIYLAFFGGVIWSQFKGIRKDIARLEKKQDKYNNLQERTLKLESWCDYHEKEHQKEQTLCQTLVGEVRN